VREGTKVVGAPLPFPPPFGPQLSPIGQVFAEVTALLRTTAHPTTDGLRNITGSAPDASGARACRSSITDRGWSHPWEIRSGRPDGR
jgi:transposase